MTWCPYSVWRSHPGYHFTFGRHPLGLPYTLSVPHFYSYWYFRWPGEFWGILVSYFVECLSIWVYLAFYSWLDRGYGFWAGRPSRWDACSLHPINCTSLLLVWKQTGRQWPIRASAGPAVRLNPAFLVPKSKFLLLQDAPFTLAGLEGCSQVPEGRSSPCTATSSHAMAEVRLSSSLGVWSLGGEVWSEWVGLGVKATGEARCPLCPQLNAHPPSIGFERKMPVPFKFPCTCRTWK